MATPRNMIITKEWKELCIVQLIFLSQFIDLQSFYKLLNSEFSFSRSDYGYLLICFSSETISTNILDQC